MRKEEVYKLANGYYAGDDTLQNKDEIKEAWCKGYECALRHYNISNAANKAPIQQDSVMDKTNSITGDINASRNIPPYVRMTGLDNLGFQFTTYHVQPWGKVSIGFKPINNRDSVMDTTNVISEEISTTHSDLGVAGSSNYSSGILTIRGDLDTIPGNQTTNVDECGVKTDTGIKESDGKVDYSEINFGILDLMAQRFTNNKHKYPKDNMLKSIDMNSLLWPVFRHWKKMKYPLPNDVETFEDHLAAIMCNCSMLLDQLNLLKLKNNINQ